MQIETEQMATFPAGMNEPLQARLRMQGCALTRSDALEFGCTDTQLRAWCRSGSLKSPGYGAYYIPVTTGTSSTPAASEPFAIEREEAMRRLRSIVLTMDESVIVTHESALLLHRLPLLVSPQEMVMHLSQHGFRKRTRRRGVVAHMVPLAMTTSLIANIRVASPAWAVAQTLCTLGVESAVVAADAALHSKVMDSAQLLAACIALVGTRGSASVAALPRLVDGRSESPGESRLRLLLDGAGFDLTPQLVVRDESGSFVARVDLAVDDSRVLIEFDGMLKYRGEENHGALVAEKRRELALNRLGYTVIRIAWGDLSYPGRVLGWVRAALANDRGHKTW